MQRRGPHLWALLSHGRIWNGTDRQYDYAAHEQDAGFPGSACRDLQTALEVGAGLPDTVLVAGRTRAQWQEGKNPAPSLRQPCERSVATIFDPAAALFIVGIAAVLPALIGGTALTVMTGSMAPSLPQGHILIYHPVSADDLKVGDVIACQPDHNITGGVPIIHRVNEVRNAGGHAAEVVQDDAKPVPDKPTRPEQIIGKMDYYIRSPGCCDSSPSMPG